MSSWEKVTVPIFRSGDHPLTKITSPFDSSIESSDFGLNQAVTKGDCIFKVQNIHCSVQVSQVGRRRSDVIF